MHPYAPCVAKRPACARGHIVFMSVSVTSAKSACVKPNGFAVSLRWTE